MDFYWNYFPDGTPGRYDSEQDKKKKIKGKGKTRVLVRLNHYYHCESVHVARGRYFGNAQLGAWEP